jgi:hypothetical protein
MANEKLDQLLNDPDFLSLPESDQNQIIDEMRQVDFGKIPKTESFLEKALKIDPAQVGYEVAGGLSPLHLGMGLGARATGQPFSSGLGIAAQAEGQRKQAIENSSMNPFQKFATGIVSDPMTYVGMGEAGGAVKGAGGAIKKVFPYTSAESRVGFTKGVESSLIKRRGALTRGYGSALDKSKGVVDISDIVDEGSEITTLTMKEAQDLKNAISQGIPDAVKKGLRIDPKHFFNRSTAGKITDAMKKADPDMATTIEKYGKHAENFKSAIAPVKSIKGPENIFGSNLIKQMFGAGGTIPEKSMVGMQEFAPKVAEKVKGAKINENIFRTIRGATIGGLGYKFVPSVLKRAFLSEVSGG